MLSDVDVSLLLLKRHGEEGEKLILRVIKHNTDSLTANEDNQSEFV